MTFILPSVALQRELHALIPDEQRSSNYKIAKSVAETVVHTGDVVNEQSFLGSAMDHEIFTDLSITITTTTVYTVTQTVKIKPVNVQGGSQRSEGLAGDSNVKVNVSDSVQRIVQREISTSQTVVEMHRTKKILRRLIPDNATCAKGEFADKVLTDSTQIFNRVQTKSKQSKRIFVRPHAPHLDNPLYENMTTFASDVPLNDIEDDVSA